MATMTVTREQVLEEVASFGTSLSNTFIIEPNDDEKGVIVHWYPEVGIRSLIIENSAMARAVYDYLRNEIGVRKFKSWDELSEAHGNEKWEGWNTCSDWLRHQ